MANLENGNIISGENILEGKKLHSIISDTAYKLFNTDNNTSIIYGDHKNGKENYKILKDIIGIEKLNPHNFQILQMVDKQIDSENIIKAFLLKIKGKNKNIFKNVTAIIKKTPENKELLHIHISEPKKLDGEKVVDLGKKYRQNHIGLENKDHNGNGVSIEDLKRTSISKKNIIKLDNSDDIAKSIMVNYWAKALLLGSNEVVKLFSPTAFLKGTVVQHLSVGYENGIKDYFDHFCERKPKMEIIDINTKWLKKGESILAYGEYLFNLSNPDQKVPGNFTMIFVEKNSRWMIDGLNSSIEYGKKI